jgi:hypothetical protein
MMDGGRVVVVVVVVDGGGWISCGGGGQSEREGKNGRRIQTLGWSVPGAVPALNSPRQVEFPWIRTEAPNDGLAMTKEDGKKLSEKGKMGG